jgi:hypothetical protein
LRFFFKSATISSYFEEELSMKAICKVTLLLSVFVLALAGLPGCATTPTVGVGYYVPISPHGNAGVDFGIGF